MTAECKVPDAAVDVPTEGGCEVSGPFDYEYANGACRESKMRGVMEKERTGPEREGRWTDRQTSGCEEEEEEDETLSYFFRTVYFIGLFSGSKGSACVSPSMRANNS